MFTNWYWGMPPYVKSTPHLSPFLRMPIGIHAYRRRFHWVKRDANISLGWAEAMEAIARLCTSHRSLFSDLEATLVVIRVVILEVNPVGRRVRSSHLRAQFNARVGLVLGHTGGAYRIARMILATLSGRHISGRSLAPPDESALT